ncbi:L-tyrosine 3-hydroxylase [Streptomyces dangxiongensis]|uniref:L-tyrosine 3-hydroxylase n=1 Tax=Streptomyces dangxiongensis TaxID=1442032 RepID=A0A3G2J7J2_9ACTN|nr:L-tyrosine 3-hydroxylase [Streptomyces dangxiongensis]AYN38233.1 L-tyrosine 3-hydroxylase [Streptomyces dangxiongensis]
MSALDAGSATGLLEAVVPEYGGRAYGIEPLMLPPDPVHCNADDELTRRYAELLGQGPDPGAEPSGAPAAAGSAEQLFWFRWITGHQLTFMLWQELGRRAAEAAGPAPPDEVAAVGRLVRGYSAMLLYTASCTRDVYLRIIRPSMALHHPAFSGAWARDYGPVRALLRGRLPAAWDGRADALVEECALNERVHEGIAAKLVPDAPSLLQSATGTCRPLPRDVRAALFDTYFITLRAPCAPEEGAAQLLRRMRAVRDDLAVNGLYPASASSRAEKPEALRTPQVEEIERAVPQLLGNIARDFVRHSSAEPASPSPPTRTFEPSMEGSGSHGA